MPENEFEHRVQEIMSQFRPEPDPEVWNVVNRRIQKEKKRRIIFWWALGLLVAGTAGLFLIFPQVHNREQTDFKFLQQTGPVKTEIQNNKKDTIVPTVLGNKKEPSVAAIPVKTEPQENTIQAKPVHELQKQNRNLITPNATSKMVRLTPNTPAEKIKESERVTKVIPLQDGDKKVLKTDPAPMVKTKLPNPLLEPVPANKKPEEGKSIEKSEVTVLPSENKIIQPLQNNTSPGKPETENEIKPGIVESMQAEKSEKKDIQWGMTLSAGRSSLIRGFRLLDNPSSRDYLSPLTSAPSANAYRPSGHRPYFSWSAEVFFKKEISPRLEIRAGAGYQYLSTQIPAGIRIDSAVTISNYYSTGVRNDNFYSPGAGDYSWYTNRFHFLSLSGDLSWQVIEGAKFPFRWNNGISLSRLLGSNMLHYDYNLRGYYRDNKRLNKSQAFFNSALSVPVSDKISLEAFGSYSLIPVLKRDDSLKLHYSHFGLRFRWLWNKK